MIYAPETIERVRYLASLALTAREIAAMTGIVSRDAVIGLCYRNNIFLLVPRRDGHRYHKRKSRFNYRRSHEQKVA